MNCKFRARALAGLTSQWQVYEGKFPDVPEYPTANAAATVQAKNRILHQRSARLGICIRLALDPELRDACMPE